MSGYKGANQQKNLAWCLPRPKKDRYKGGMPLYAEEWLIDLAMDILQQDDISMLNLFCGMSQFGFRIDLREEVHPDLCCDAHSFAHLLNGDRFDVILADPPYSSDESRDLYGTPPIEYKIWTREADRVLNVGGLLIVYHKYMMPNPDPDKYRLECRVFIGTRIYHVPRVATYFRKIV